MRLARLLSVVAGAALLSSCSLGLIVRLANASSQAIFITNYDGKSSAIIEPGKDLELHALVRGPFTVTRAAKAHWYQLHDEAPSFERIEGFIFFERRILVASYAEDGCIDAMPPTPGAVVNLRAIQPKGFPVCAGNEFVKPRGVRRQ